jgi:hypothetical protein
MVSQQMQAIHAERGTQLQDDYKRINKTIF